MSWVVGPRGEPPFREGEVVHVVHDLLRGDHGLVIPCWHLRHAQHRSDGWIYFAQAVPVGIWPARFSWLPECYLLPTGLWWPVKSFREQDEMFDAAGRGNQLRAKREPYELRAALSEEVRLVRALEAKHLPFRGVGGSVWLEQTAHLTN